MQYTCMIPSSDLYLFRVGHDNSASYFIEGTGIIASNFCSRTNTGTRQLTHTVDRLENATWGPGIPFDAVTIQHMRHRSRMPTPFISTTTSLLWAIWEAERQIAKGDRGVKLFTIDAIAVNHHAERATAKIAEFVTNNAFKPEYKDFFAFADNALEVIVDYYMPAEAITWSSWQSLRAFLPSWFFQSVGVAFRTCDDRHPPFKNWTRSVDARFYILSKTDKWIALRYREAAIFSFYLFAPQLEAESPTSMRKRAVINRATALAFALIPNEHKLNAESHPTKAIEYEVLQLTLAKWPKVSHPLTTEPLQGPATDSTTSEDTPSGGQSPSNTQNDDGKQNTAGQEGSIPEASYILEGMIGVIGIIGACRKLFAFARA